MLLGICRWTRTQNYYLLRDGFLETAKQIAFLITHPRELWLCSFCLLHWHFPFLYWMKIQTVKASWNIHLEILLWNKSLHCQNRNWCGKFLFLLKNKQTKQCKSQTMISVWFMTTKGPSIFVCKLGWGPKTFFFFFFWWMKPETFWMKRDFFAQNKIIFCWTICEGVNIWLS